MMTCRKLVELLIDFVSGELPPEHRALAEKHLSTCPPCVAYLHSYQVTIRLTRQLPCHPLPASLKERLMEALREIEREKSAPPGGSGDCGDR
jgi:anti-sigma factor RsiW